MVGRSTRLKGARVIKPVKRKILTVDEFSKSVVGPRQDEAFAARNLRPCQLVYRNYWWQLIDGPGIVYEEHTFNDGSGPPKFDFLTVSLMGWDAIFDDDQGRPAPFPQAFASVNVGEVPLSTKYWVQMGFLDPYLDPRSCTVQLRHWHAELQIGFYGWTFV